ncbi:MAG: hypothetical protein HUJ26_04500 [Planctomycetaceae bacterium]|nr:hypothetical protein [Planctomycetaceae bacterium]
MTSPAWLPEIITLNDHDGNWQNYIDAVYAVFENDFIKSKCHLKGKEVGVRRETSYDGKWFTFWHCVSEGRIEEDRTPDFRRSERVPWIRPTIEHETEDTVDVWTTKKNREQRLYLWVNEEYIVVLGVRKKYFLLITAFPTNRTHTVEKLRRERDSNQS